MQEAVGLDQIVQLNSRELTHHFGQTRLVAGATIVEGGRFAHSHPFLMEEPIKQTIRREFRVDQFRIAQRCEQGAGA